MPAGTRLKVFQDKGSLDPAAVRLSPAWLADEAVAVWLTHTERP